MDRILEYTEALEYFNTTPFNQKPLLRGESRYYDTCFPSFKRTESFLEFAGVLVNLRTHIFDSKIRSWVQMDYEFVYYNGQPFGARNLLDQGDLSVKHIMWGLEGLLQHYGFPTMWIDLTFDVETALYFACQENESEIGFLYYTENYNFNWGELIDIASFAKDLRNIIRIPDTRPERQKGLALRARYDLKPRLKCLKVRKPTVIPNRDDYFFPRDALKMWLYGQLIDYYYDYLIRSQAFLERGYGNKDDHEQYQASLEKVISHYGLW